MIGIMMVQETMMIVKTFLHLQGVILQSRFDDIGCSTTQTYTLNEPTEMTGSTTANVIGCGLNDGTASVTVNGGTVTNDYTYFGQTMEEIKLVLLNTITSQPAGCYNISVTDDNGCAFLDIACINNPTGPTITLIKLIPLHVLVG